MEILQNVFDFLLFMPRFFMGAFFDVIVFGFESVGSLPFNINAQFNLLPSDVVQLLSCTGLLNALSFMILVLPIRLGLRLIPFINVGN